MDVLVNMGNISNVIHLQHRTIHKAYNERALHAAHSNGAKPTRQGGKTTCGAKDTGHRSDSVSQG